MYIDVADSIFFSHTVMNNTFSHNKHNRCRIAAIMSGTLTVTLTREINVIFNTEIVWFYCLLESVYEFP